MCNYCESPEFLTKEELAVLEVMIGEKSKELKDKNMWYNNADGYADKLHRISYKIIQLTK